MKTIQRVTNNFKHTNLIRNVSVIAHVDHGKTTLVDNLIQKAGMLSAENSGGARYMDTSAEEQMRQITITSTGISLCFDYNDENYTVNLIDSPGHVDFSSEVTAALRLTDGALVVVDCIEGVCVQTETVLRQALGEKIRPVLHINKVDRAIKELNLDSAAMYNMFEKAIMEVNEVLVSYNDEHQLEINPVLGNVSFGSGYQGWAFTLPQVAKMICKETGSDYRKTLRKLWGHYYVDNLTKHITKQSCDTEGNPNTRYICKAFFDRLIKAYHACMDPQLTEERLHKLLNRLRISLPSKDKQLRGSKLVGKVLSTWIPAGNALIEMMAEHLPSPLEAQRYRVDKLYDGPLDDQFAESIRTCNPDGPLIMYVSKLVPAEVGNKFFACGRVFSGTVSTSQLVYVIDGTNDGSYQQKRVQRVVLLMGKIQQNVDACPCGNIIALAGIDDGLGKCGTVTSDPEAYPIKQMNFKVSPVVRVTIIPKQVSSLYKLVSALKRLSRGDPGLDVSITETEMVIAGAGVLHVEVAVNDLRKAIPDVDFDVGEPIVKFSETITEAGPSCLAKTANKLNRFYISAQPLDSELIEYVEQDNTELDTTLKQHGWEPNEIKSIWAWEGTNCFVDTTSQVQYLTDVKDTIIASFRNICNEGALCGEPLRGIRFNLTNALVHSDNSRRGAAQVMPATLKALKAAQLSSKPTLQEPFYRATIETFSDVSSKVYGLVSHKRGYVQSEDHVGQERVIMDATLPVLESFTFTSDIRSATGGRAFPTLMFSHWSLMQGVEDESSACYQAVVETRQRKGLKEGIPEASTFVDRL